MWYTIYCTVHKTVKASIVSFSTHQIMTTRRRADHSSSNNRSRASPNKDGKQYGNSSGASQAYVDYRSWTSRPFHIIWLGIVSFLGNSRTFLKYYISKAWSWLSWAVIISYSSVLYVITRKGRVWNTDYVDNRSGNSINQGCEGQHQYELSLSSSGGNAPRTSNYVRGGRSGNSDHVDRGRGGRRGWKNQKDHFHNGPSRSSSRDNATRERGGKGRNTNFEDRGKRKRGNNNQGWNDQKDQHQFEGPWSLRRDSATRMSSNNADREKGGIDNVEHDFTNRKDQYQSEASCSSSADNDIRKSPNWADRERGNNINKDWSDRKDQHQSEVASLSSSGDNTTRKSANWADRERGNNINKDWRDQKDQHQSEVASLSSSRDNITRFSGSVPKFNGIVPKDSKKNKPQGPEGSVGLHMGIPLNQLKRAPECFKGKEKSLNESKGSPGHKILCNIEPVEVTCEASQAFRSSGTNYSSEDHVSMPYTKYGNESKISSPCSRWEKIKNALRFDIGNSFALEKVIQSYSNPPLKLTRFNILHQYFQIIDAKKGCSFFEDTLPMIKELALQLPELCPEALPFLKQRTNMKITLSQHQVACLLANAFFCTFPNQNSKRRGGDVPPINFDTLYSDEWSSHRKIEKLKCIINYFERVTKNMPSGNVTYARQFETVKPDFWYKMEKKLTDLHISTDGTIEDVGKGMLQADFANKFVGGGVLKNGLVQEEIRFVLCPEMILSRLFTEVLTNNEALVMTGCERFSDYTGYSDTFLFKGNHEDNTERDPLSRRYTEVAAMDALVFRNSYKSQFEQNNLLRELNKAYCAFKGSESDTDLPAVCTGNWGCGAFGGDKQLKALIQVMAASANGRDVCYLTFGDAELCSQFGNIHQILKEKSWTISNIVTMVQEYGIKLNKGTRESLFEYIEKRLIETIKIPGINETRNDNRKAVNNTENKREENYGGNKSGEENIHGNKSVENLNKKRGKENVENRSAETVEENRSGEGNFNESIREDIFLHENRWEENVENRSAETVEENRRGEENVHENLRGDNLQKNIRGDNFENRSAETVEENRRGGENLQENTRRENLPENIRRENFENRSAETVEENRRGEENTRRENLQENTRRENLPENIRRENFENRSAETVEENRRGEENTRRENLPENIRRENFENRSAETVEENRRGEENTRRENLPENIRRENFENRSAETVEENRRGEENTRRENLPENIRRENFENRSAETVEENRRGEENTRRENLQENTRGDNFENRSAETVEENMRGEENLQENTRRENLQENTRRENLQENTRRENLQENTRRENLPENIRGDNFENRSAETVQENRRGEENTREETIHRTRNRESFNSRGSGKNSNSRKQERRRKLP